MQRVSGLGTSELRLCLFEDDEALFLYALGQFAAECEAAGMRTSNSEAMLENCGLLPLVWGGVASTSKGIS